MPGPRLGQVVVGGSGEQAQRAAAGLVSRAHAELDVHRVLVGQHQRGFQRQFLDLGAAHAGRRTQRQFHVGRAGQQHGAHDRVVGQPRVRAQ